ncbi:MAG: HDOD domain-containing protein, partial [candidate division Zixibacteria bacterium]|nr:HDOD domain-containing protein [candidate division Zixibacteria bacterium]
ALTGRLLKIANSPFYGLTGRVGGVHQATMVLGLTTVKCIALSAAIFDSSKITTETGIDIESFYGNIISVAATCRKLAIECNYSSPEEAFTCGLLYDVGTLYFVHHYPDIYGKVLKKAQKRGNVIDEEKIAFGISHPEVGRLIAEKWHLPSEIVSALANHYTCGNRDSKLLDDIVRLAVALNRDMVAPSDQYIEDKITKIGIISERIGLDAEKLDNISSSVVKETLEFAELIDINIGNIETILTRANQEIFKTYMSIQNLFKQRQELTSRILHEERERGLLEAKQVAVSTLAHYINNASMQISGQSQIIRMFLERKSADEIVSGLPNVLNSIDEAIQKTVAVLEEISELNMLDDMEYFDRSKILNIDERIKSRLDKFKKDTHGIVLPDEAEIARDN